MNKLKEPILETERLILRPLTVDDAEACFYWTGDPVVNKFMSYPVHSDISVTIDYLSSLNNTKGYKWGIVLKENNLLIGSCGIGENNYIEGYWGIGYNIRKDYWNQGYTTEAVKEIIKYGHEKLGVKKFCSDHAVDNPASGRVMEKCGLKFHHYGEYSKTDNSVTFKAKFYTLEIED